MSGLPLATYPSPFSRCTLCGARQVLVVETVGPVGVCVACGLREEL